MPSPAWSPQATPKLTTNLVAALYLPTYRRRERAIETTSRDDLSKENFLETVIYGVIAVLVLLWAWGRPPRGPRRGSRHRGGRPWQVVVADVDVIVNAIVADIRLPGHSSC